MGKTLSILMMSYNQGDYILEAIQSVFKQNLPFEWELLIGDDFSQDNTELLIQNYLTNNPSNNVKYYRHQYNLGLHKNYEFLVKASQGTYIALLEADDYWIDSNKCRLQVNVMEQDLNIAWTFTDGIIVDQNKKLIKEVKSQYPTIMDSEYFVKNFFNPLSNTIIYRKSFEPTIYPAFFYKIRQWDTVLLYLRILNNNFNTNKIGYVSVNGLAWRRHDKTVSNTLFHGKERYYDWIILSRELKKLVPKHLKKFLNMQYVAYEYLSLISLKEKDYFSFFRFFILSLIFKPFRSFNSYRDYFWKIRSVNVN